MEQRTIRLNFDLSLVYGPRTLRIPLMAVMLLAAVGDLNSESVTLSTYYPAPSGVYTNMITTGNTFLARDGGAGTKVGIGTTGPGAKLAVSGSMSVGAGYAGTVPPADALIVSGKLGIGIAAPAQALDIAGNINLASGGSGNGYIHINASGCDALPTTAVAGTNPLCAAGRYATFTPGVYIEGTSFQNNPSPFLVAPNGVTRIYRAWGTWGANQVEMPLGAVDTARYVCCNK
ncbi:MAG: hypothetical protein PHS14_14785 [Elusimicrobia bacterium]|nr:hypothetical protein [Elusimicrobiota bacterium]